MPFKRNPINAEKLNSLGRMLAQLPRIAWDNAAHSLLERTLDDSANRRTTTPEAFLIADEMINVAHRIIKDLVVQTKALSTNLQTYAPFAATEKILIEAVKQGADRQELHEVIRQHAIIAWREIQQGNENPLPSRLENDQKLQSYLSRDTIRQILNTSDYIGIAADRAKKISIQKNRLSDWLVQNIS